MRELNKLTYTYELSYPINNIETLSYKTITTSDGKETHKIKINKTTIIEISNKNTIIKNRNLYLRYQHQIHEIQKQIFSFDASKLKDNKYTVFTKIEVTDTQNNNYLYQNCKNYFVLSNCDVSLLDGEELHALNNDHIEIKQNGCMGITTYSYKINGKEKEIHTLKSILNEPKEISNIGKDILNITMKLKYLLNTHNNDMKEFVISLKPTKSQ